MTILRTWNVAAIAMVALCSPLNSEATECMGKFSEKLVTGVTRFLEKATAPRLEKTPQEGPWLESTGVEYWTEANEAPIVAFDKSQVKGVSVTDRKQFTVTHLLTKSKSSFVLPKEYAIGNLGFALSGTLFVASWDAGPAHPKAILVVDTAHDQDTAQQANDNKVTPARALRLSESAVTPFRFNDRYVRSIQAAGPYILVGHSRFENTWIDGHTLIKFEKDGTGKPASRQVELKEKSGPNYRSDLAYDQHGVVVTIGKDQGYTLDPDLSNSRSIKFSTDNAELGRKLLLISDEQSKARYIVAVESSSYDAYTPNFGRLEFLERDSLKSVKTIESGLEFVKGIDTDGTSLFLTGQRRNDRLADGNYKVHALNLATGSWTGYHHRASDAQPEVLAIVYGRPTVFSPAEYHHHRLNRFWTQMTQY